MRSPPTPRGPRLSARSSSPAIDFTGQRHSRLTVPVGHARRQDSLLTRGARRADPHAPHAEGLRAGPGRPGDARRAVRARALGAQPPPHQPVALPGARPAGARGAQGRRRAGGRRASSTARRRSSPPPRSRRATRSPTRRTSPPPRARASSSCSARTRAGSTATGARPRSCARRRAARRAGSRTASGCSACCTSAAARAPSPRPSARRSRTSGVPGLDARARGRHPGAGRRAVRRARDRRRHHRRRRGARRRHARLLGRARGARRLRDRHLVALEQARPRRPALPAELRPRARPRGAAGAPDQRRARAAPGAAAAADRARLRRRPARTGSPGWG